MPLPQPPVALKDQCTIIYNDILYSYQSDAFQSLDLKKNATWSKLPMGVSTTGSACVSGSVDGKDAFIVVGGSASAQKYSGLQHYSFADKEWHSDTSSNSVASNRKGHGAAFLQQSSSILMYAGSQMDDKTPSSETFLISTKSPYNTQAFSSNATPVTDPLILSYNSTHALMLGGADTNTKLYTFGPDEGWHELSVGLENPLKDSSKVQASVLTGSDGSKLLEIFDLSVSPNKVSSLVLQKASGSSSDKKSNGGRRARSYSLPKSLSRKRKRETSLADRPAYNSTGAPRDARTGFSLADSDTGLVVATGGQSQEPLAIFNQTGNQWIDPNSFFGNEPTTTSSSTFTSSLPTTTPTSSTAPPAAATTAAERPAHNVSHAILGGVLGGIFGIALLVGLIILLLICCRRRREKRRAERDSGFPLDNKPMDFQDVGADYMKESGAAAGTNHRRNRSNRSDGSVTLQNADRGGANTSQSQRALLHAKGDSTSSQNSFWDRIHTRSPSKTPPFISAPILEPSFTDMAPESRTDPRTEPRSDTGWSRYFTNNNSREMLSSLSPPGQDKNRRSSNLSGGQSPSDWTNSRIPSSQPHTSAEVAPLSFRASQPGNPPNTRLPPPPPVFAGPALGLALTHGSDRGQPVAPPTPSTVVSDIDEEGEEFHHYSHESDGHDSWSPVAAAGERGSTWTDDRPISSSNTNSQTTRSTTQSQSFPHPGERVRIPEFPMPMPSNRNSTMTSPVSPSNDDARSMRNIMSKDFAGPSSTDGSRQRPTAPPIPPPPERQRLDFTRTDSGRQHALPIVQTGMQRVDSTSSSTAGVGRSFPRPKEGGQRLRLGTTESEDMSWLNLGGNGGNTAAERDHRYFPGR